MAGSVNPLWNDSAGGFPPASPPTAASILGRYIVEVPDPNLDFQNETTAKAWFRDGQQLFAAGAITNMARRGKDSIPRDHALIASLLKGSTPANFTADEPDVDLPSDCYLFLEAVCYPDTENEVQCVEIPWSWDFRARNRRQYMPTDERPLVAVRADGKAVRFYVAGGIAATMQYVFRYLRIPAGTFLDPDDASAEKSDLPDPFNRGPLSYAVGRWYASRETDPEPYLKEFAAALTAALPPDPQEPA